MFKKMCHSVWQICLKNLNFGKWQHNTAANENLTQILVFIFKCNIRAKHISEHKTEQVWTKIKKEVLGFNKWHFVLYP